MNRRAAGHAGAAWALVLALASSRTAGAVDLIENYDFTTRARWEAAVGTRHPVDQKQELSVESTFDAQLVGGFDLVTIGRLRADPADRLSPGRPDQHAIWEPSRSLLLGDDTELALRELYLHRRFGRVHVTAGKQQVVWGTADGIKVLDLVNPQDFREFILDDFVDSRLPTWMLNVGFPLEMFQVQLLWIPDRSYAQLAEPGSVYALTSPQFVPPNPAGLAVRTQNPHRPSGFIEDSEAGARLSTTVAGCDLSLNYLWAYDDVPVPSRSLGVDDGNLLITVTPQYRRTHYVGGSLSRTIGNWVLRGEFAYSSNRKVYTLDLFDADGLADGREAGSVVGLDWFGLANTLASVQFFARYVDVEQHADTSQGGWTTIPTVLLRRTMAGDRLAVQLFWLQDAARGDGMARASLRWEARDDLALLLGADILYGTSRGIFGEFDDADRFTIGVEATK